MEARVRATEGAQEGAGVPTWHGAVAHLLSVVEALSARPSTGPSAPLTSLFDLPAGSVAAGRFLQGLC